MARRTLLTSYIATYLISAGAIIRIILRFQDDRLALILPLLIAYIILLGLEPSVISRTRNPSYIYLLAQTAIITTLSIIISEVDFWAVLFFSIIFQAMRRLPQRTGFMITGAFSAIMALSMFLGLGSGESLPLLLINVVVYFFLAAFIAISREAELAREEIQFQQAELLAAHKKLQIYTNQAEESAIQQERGRLARELHDSITQSLHSSTLLAEAGQRLASAGDIERARGYLIRLGDISQQALKEMRLLIYELRPLALREIGLVGALQQRLDAVERRAGVEAQLYVEETLEIPRKIEEDLFRIAMEALNNSLKHADPTSVTVTLRVDDEQDVSCLELEILDDGKGFDLNALGDTGGMGLVSMQERIEALGGEFAVHSAPGEGTRVKVCVDITPSSSISSAPEE